MNVTEELWTLVKTKCLLPLMWFIVLSSACTLPFLKTNTQEALRDRVRLLWEARIKGDRGTIYEMADNKFKKEVCREHFIKRGNLVIKEFTIVNVEVQENGKQGSSMVIFETIRMGKLFEISIKEIWIFEDRQWHLKISDRRTPFDKRTR
jgi:hypothetical protein